MDQDTLHFRLCIYILPFKKLNFKGAFLKSIFIHFLFHFLVNGTELEPRVRIRKCKGGKKFVWIWIYYKRMLGGPFTGQGQMLINSGDFFTLWRSTWINFSLQCISRTFSLSGIFRFQLNHIYARGNFHYPKAIQTLEFIHFFASAIQYVLKSTFHPRN